MAEAPQREVPIPLAVTLPGPSAEIDLPIGREVRTRNVRLRLVAFGDLPGWMEDDPATAWAALRQSCKALQRRPHWDRLCVEAVSLRVQDAAALRGFLQRAFAVWRVLNPDGSSEGVVTGYFEPLVAGSLEAGGPYRVPVYGVPRDMIFLDRRDLGASVRAGPIPLQQAGRMLKPLREPVPEALWLNLDQVPQDTLDRRLRLRREGQRLLPYFSRAEIEARPPLDAPVIAWLDDPLALYAMQTQGSGRIRLPDGRLMRVVYADQNGHPFRPMKVRVSGADNPAKTRGIRVDEVPERFELESGDSPIVELEEAVAKTPPTAKTRGTKPTPRMPAATSAPGGSPADELIRQLKPNTGPLVQASSPAASSIQVLRQDPSYVFFRVAPDQAGEPGPTGAMGVPLTAGRSVAVDPRATPLGYPVFLTTEPDPGGRPGMRKLVFAQDTGGAIRGAVRADHFWGYGREAARQAARTNERGRMWLLMPRAEAATLLKTKGATRGLGDAMPECLVVDDEHCVE